MSVALATAGMSTTSALAARAVAASVLKGIATAHLHLIEAEGATLIEEGKVTGALTGEARAELHAGGVFKARFTIKTRAGDIYGEGEAKPSGDGRYQSFKGTFRATHGSGRYAHIKGQAELYGVYDRQKESATIQTTGGKLTY
jgi:hypothetical protein